MPHERSRTLAEPSLNPRRRQFISLTLSSPPFPFFFSFSFPFAFAFSFPSSSSFSTGSNLFSTSGLFPPYFFLSFLTISEAAPPAHELVLDFPAETHLAKTASTAASSFMGSFAP